MAGARLRSLERRLVLERAEEEVECQVDQLLLEWDVALYLERPLPQPFEFINRIMDAGFYLPTRIKAVHYISECKQEGKVPERRELLQILLPWLR